MTSTFSNRYPIITKACLFITPFSVALGGSFAFENGLHALAFFTSTFIGLTGIGICSLACLDSNCKKTALEKPDKNSNLLQAENKTQTDIELDLVKTHTPALTKLKIRIPTPTSNIQISSLSTSPR